MIQNALKLKAGDILIFGKTKQGELLLGGRARTASDKDRKAPPRTRKSDGAPGDKPVVKSVPQPPRESPTLSLPACVPGNVQQLC